MIKLGILLVHNNAHKLARKDTSFNEHTKKTNEFFTNKSQIYGIICVFCEK